VLIMIGREFCETRVMRKSDDKSPVLEERGVVERIAVVNDLNEIPKG
jgi:hypothetical protein